MLGTSRVEKRLAEAEEELRKLRREFVALELEWSLAYDKLKSMMQRIAKRAEVVEKAADQENNGSASQVGPTPGPLFSGRAAEAQAAILRRRSRLTNPGGS